MPHNDTQRLSLLTVAVAAGLIAAPMLAFAQADGTPGNPPGTAAGRAIDRATTPDGTPGNPPGTAAGRAIDRATTPDATPGNAVGNRAGTAGAPATSLLPPTAMAPALAMVRPRVSQLIGGNVYNERNERIGEVDDILLAPPGSTATATSTSVTAIIQIGGFLGLGGRLVTLPLSELRWNAEREHLVMPGATRESLGARPAFEYSSLRAR